MNLAENGSQLAYFEDTHLILSPAIKNGLCHTSDMNVTTKPIHNNGFHISHTDWTAEIQFLKVFMLHARRLCGGDRSIKRCILF